MPTIRSDGLAVEYPGFALGPINVELTDGITCLVGANGAGKSTLFRALTGIERARRGSVTLDGAPLRGGDVGYLPQELSLPGRATCVQYLTHVAWLRGVPRSERARAVETALAGVGLEQRASSKIRTLSGGMRRRLSLAHALVHSPQVLLLDEPTVGLDPLQRVAMRGTIAQATSGRLAVVSTHLVDDVAALAQRVLVIRHGAVVFSGDLVSLESAADENAPGSSPLEKAIATLISEDPVSCGAQP